MTAPTFLRDLDADLPEATRPPGLTVGIELGAWYVPVTVYPDGTTELGIARREGMVGRPTPNIERAAVLVALERTRA